MSKSLKWEYVTFTNDALDSPESQVCSSSCTLHIDILMDQKVPSCIFPNFAAYILNSYVYF